MFFSKRACSVPSSSSCCFAFMGGILSDIGAHYVKSLGMLRNFHTAEVAGGGRRV
jgi:hypothetical protein